MAATTISIFGASGDLTHRKLIPALFQLHRKGRLPDGLRVVGFSRSPFDDDGFRESLREGLEKLAGALPDAGSWHEFAQRISYVHGDIGKDADFHELDEYLRAIESELGGCEGRVYYLSVAPRLFGPTAQRLGAAGMARETDGWRRLVVEKPFGRDGASARALTEGIHGVFREDQTFRIDHYLGKDTVQNLLVFRFSNTIFEPIWNRNYIDHVQITVAEQVTIAHRGAYYDENGVLRDMFQNHLLQLLALTAMEPSVTFEADALRNEKAKVLQAIRRPNVDAVAEMSVRGQYEGYRSEEGVDTASQTATYAALELYVDNWRWQGVPFLLRSGKGLARKTSEIVVCFKRPPHPLFMTNEGRELHNTLSMCLQPDEGVHLGFEAKIPDHEIDTGPVAMEFHYATAFGGSRIPDAYERLLLDLLDGDAALFTRADEIAASWAAIDPILVAWDRPGAPPLEIYPRGSWGPPSAHRLIRRRAGRWLLQCEH
ncbi:MAG: glucose-6-phosphate dehydrogenase [Longimicrobiales bacterium]